MVGGRTEGRFSSPSEGSDGPATRQHSTSAFRPLASLPPQAHTQSERSLPATPIRLAFWPDSSWGNSRVGTGRQQKVLKRERMGGCGGSRRVRTGSEMPAVPSAPRQLTRARKGKGGARNSPDGRAYRRLGADEGARRLSHTSPLPPPPPHIPPLTSSRQPAQTPAFPPEAHRNDALDNERETQEMSG